MEVGTVLRVDIEEKVRSAYLDYAMSVITARALPDVRDGLKPVQRRILYAMHDMGLRHDAPTRKSARIVGEVLGKYHPHGDTAVYDAMVRMAQDFSMRYALVDGQGNFGSIDGDNAAAMRYTEARLSAIGEEMLRDLDKDTVDFGSNFDGSLQEPTVLPAKLPNLLVNGVGGIAVGMATNIPPHNLGEIADAIAYLVDHYDTAEEVSVDELMHFVQGPDFPTGGLILGREGIRQAYATGRGCLIMRAHTHIEELSGGRSAIIVTELPYQVNKANLVERIATLAREERVQGIGDLRDESDRSGMRIVIELKRGVEPMPVLNELLKYTQLQATFGANMLALVDGEPRYLSLKRALLHYIEHRHEVLERRTRYELERAQARAHVLEGLLIALDNLDAVIDSIRRSRTADTARANLMRQFKLTEIQAQAILDLQLRRLAALERRRIEEEYKEVLAHIEYLHDLLSSKAKILALVKSDVLELKKTLGDARRTHIAENTPLEEARPEDLLPNERMMVLLLRTGHVLRLPLSTASSASQSVPGLVSGDKRGVLAFLEATGQDRVLFVTDQGNAYGLPVHQLPDARQQKEGLPLANLVHMSAGEHPVAALPLEEKKGYLCLATRQGRIKRLALSDLKNGSRSATQIIGLGNGDTLGWATLTDGESDLIMVTAQGKAIRFQESTVRPQGCSATGMRGISLQEGDEVVGMDVVRDGGELLIATAVGYAKRSDLDEYSVQGRGGQGALTVDVAKSEQTGPLVAAAIVRPDEKVLFTTADGATQAVAVKEVPALKRTTWGRIVTRTRRHAVVQIDNAPVVGLVALRTATETEPSSSPSERPPRRAHRRTMATESPAEEEGSPPLKTTRVRRRATSSRTRRRAASSPEELAEAATTEAETAEATKKALPSRTRRSSGAKASAEESPPPGSTEDQVKDTPTKRRTRRTTVTRPPRRTRSGS